MASSGAEVITIDVQEAKNLINSGYGYLDVRTVEEYKKGHVAAAKIFNIPYMFNTPDGRVKNPEFLKEVSAACSKEDNLVVGCQIGVRSLSATADLQNAIITCCLTWNLKEFDSKLPKSPLMNHIRGTIPFPHQ